MACIGYHFNFKMEYRYIQLYCTVVMLTVLCFTGIIYEIFAMVSHYSTYALLIENGSIFLANSILSAISLSFIILVWSLNKRFAILNQYLRLCGFHLKVLGNIDLIIIIICLAFLIRKPKQDPIFE